jgi:hypothetical protein
MKHLNYVIYLVGISLMSCTPKIENNNSVGKVENNTYNMLTKQLTEELKRRFQGNMYESEKITAVDLKDEIKVGIPESTTYLFKKDDSKYIKGDLNNDKKTDLIIWADLIEKQGPKTRKYFVFIQKNEDTYEYLAEFKADDMVFDNCRNTILNVGNFYLDSISAGMLIGHTEYQGTYEANYLDYSYRCATEKYIFDTKTQEIKLTFQSDLEKKNTTTGVFEKVEKK